MSSIFWYQTYEMCGCLNRSYSLSCSTWGQEGPRPAQTFAGLSGRCWAVPSPLAAPQLQPPSPDLGTWDPTDADSSYWPTSLTVCLHVKRCHCPFPRRMCLFFQFPCYLFVFSTCNSLKAPCLCSSCLCVGYFWKLRNQEEGWNSEELTAVEVESSFPWCALSSFIFLLVTSVVRPPLHCSFQGKLTPMPLCPASDCFLRGDVPLHKRPSLLFCFSGSATWPKSGRWSSRVPRAVKHLGGYVP